jgi:hypothetical protein
LTSTKAPPVTAGLSRYEAAKKLRLGLRRLVDFSVVSGNPREVREQLNEARAIRISLEECIRARQIANSLMALDRMMVKIERAIALLQRMEDRDTPAIQGELKHFYHLAQCLPTAPGIPTTRNENVVRALVAVLRAQGYTIDALSQDEEVIEDDEDGEEEVDDEEE